MLTKTKLFMQICKFEVGGGGEGREGFVTCGQDGDAIEIGLRFVQSGRSKQALECYVTGPKQKHRRRSSTQDASK